MKVGILGSGEVAKALGAGFLAHDHDVMLGTRDTEKLKAWAEYHVGAHVGGVAEAAGHGELVVLAVKGAAAADVLRSVGASSLNGKPVVDATNPIADEPPDNAVIRFFTGPNESLMERLQAEFPGAHLVKAFNSVGNQHMVDPEFGETAPTMFICGNDEGAKQTARGLLEEFGWEAADMGGAEAARAIEPLCMLWCIPGLLRGEWDHSFKLLRQSA